jgi:hypothetical protein
VGEVAKTKEPEPVSSVTAAAKLDEDGVPKNVAMPVPKDVMPVPPLATGRVPVTLVARFARDCIVFKFPDESKTPLKVHTSLTCNVATATWRCVPLLSNTIVIVTAAVSVFCIVIFFITLRVNDAGAETRVTSEVPFKTPSCDPSVNADPVLSAYETTKSGLLVVEAPDILALTVFVVVSNINTDIVYP